MKIFVTGAKGSGKSTLVQTIIKKCSLETTGFLTLPLFEGNHRIGFYFHSIVPVDHNDQRFSIQQTDCNEVIPGIFDQLGVKCLCHSQGDRYIIMDEIGYLEREEQAYLNVLEKTIQKNKNIIGVLRKCDIQYIRKIRQRKDILLIDLDTMSFSQAEQYIIESIHEGN